MFDRKEFIKEMSSKAKERVKELFNQHKFGDGKIWAVLMVPMKGTKVVDLYPYTNLTEIKEAPNPPEGFLVFRGETDLLDGTEEESKK